MEDNNYYVYRHIRLDSNTPFYVGKGKENRAYSKQRNKYWHRITSKTGFEVEIFISNLTEEQAFNKEKEFIKLYRDYGYKLANLTDGGDGLSGWSPSNETREKISRGNSNKPKSESHRKAMSDARKGMKLSEQHRHNIAEGNKGKKMSRVSTEKAQQTMKQLRLQPGYIHSMEGKKHSEETKMKMSNASKGRKKQPRSDEYKRKMREISIASWARRRGSV